jgi:hypothetical protein
MTWPAAGRDNHRIDKQTSGDCQCSVRTLDVVDQIKRKADFLVLVRRGDEGSSLAPQIPAYRSRDGRIN